jgi:hypothetical protein
MGNPLSAPGRSEGGIPNGRGSSGAEANRSRSSSDSCRRFVLALGRDKSLTHWLPVSDTKRIAYSHSNCMQAAKRRVLISASAEKISKEL